MALTEFGLIERFFKQQRVQRSDVDLGIGDDAALVTVPAGQQLVVAIDTLVAGVHFPVDTSPAHIGYKSLAVNLSDLAAMGAEPAWATLALTLPESNADWLAAFAAGFFELAERYQLQLIGGDTCRGPLTVSVQIAGLVPTGQALMRSKANIGDLIFVTGQIGDAGIGLKLRLDLDRGHPARKIENAAYFIERLEKPQPRIDAGLALRGLATAAIDVSDGLAADLGHILEASGVGAVINLEQLPVATELKKNGDAWWQMAISAGDDYELCFTASADQRQEVEQAMQRIGCPCACIGQIESKPGLRLHLAGRDQKLAVTGYQHFGS
ncbi:MAG: thiamine-phosphate kinase [Gammaproteobacteria bacterium]|nr:thiamine-phosphate kinase [Gammaproteobacteria bacterium]